MKKTLFDIKRNPKLTSLYAKAVEYVNRYYTQEKPIEMKWEEWEEKRVTKNKVLSYLKRLLSKQHIVERDEIRLVKTNYGLRLKGYSSKTRKLVKKEHSVQSISFNEMVLHNEYPFSDRTYQNVWTRKVRAYEKQKPAFEGMERSQEIDSYLDHFSLYKKSTQEVIKPNEKQKHDLGLVLQKNQSILSWQQGSGKSIAAMVWYRNLVEKKLVRNVFVVSAALAIHLTWTPNLEDFSENFIVIRSLTDIRSIKPGQVVLISLNMLTKYKRQIQKFIRMQSQKVALVMDESDELSNHRSLRTSATLACFRRVRYKLLTTGTITRNNINECYGQLELIYNNSINLLCDCKKIYKLDKEGKIVEEENNGYMKPFPAYTGLNLFKKCFSPSKITVFGVKKHNQNVYNKDNLTEIIRKTVITRKFQEIVGKKIHDPIPHRILQNEAEREVYSKIIEEFHEMMHYFRSTGHSGKDSMLRIIRQIQLLIKSTSSPQFFAEYTSTELPTKVKYILDLVNSFDEKVAIGTVFVETAAEYYRLVRETFPNRPVYLIKGDVDFNTRINIISSFEASSNGILISTQQSLKSSVNIPSCNKVIIEALQWNLPKIEQYYFRFIRYNSTERKEIHMVTYDHTIEVNLLALLMAKERINEYFKTLDFKDEAEIFDEYGIDIDILNDIMEKEHDENGKVRITWGEQKIS
ncbi:helicase-related protein [Paenibacillus sp. FSL L8-0709]|uniref:helicase-related protein n=1 Tax=Paenibacillus sp. FSL L8-0709 TaxID=2975312 RepID=UPI0030FC22EE